MSLSISVSRTASLKKDSKPTPTGFLLFVGHQHPPDQQLMVKA